ncbi:hypothetical protein Vafri_7664 [Volvox africanus]|uniref:START domain-containing protein n=1 Tax=Volvox africanus TaxID=51714 RepID=A0A8J4B2J6_9CHLO|nr:hypothetical protein Vafri_7664 [Volvox africanus]
MSHKWDAAVLIGKRASILLAIGVSFFLGALVAARGHVPSAFSSVATYNCIEQLYMFLESVATLGSPVQWMVALLGLCLYPALNRTSRTVSFSTIGAVDSPVPSTQGLSRPCGPGSHSIQLEHQRSVSKGQRPPGGGFFKRLRRVLAEGRAQARRLCGQESLRTAVANLSRRRSFASRSSKSEDMLSSRLSMDSVLRSTQQNAGGTGRSGLLQRKGSTGTAGSSRWQPSMSRIASGQHLAVIAPSESSMSSVTAGKRLETLSYNGFQAVDCMSHEMTDPLFTCVRQVVTDAHLLQFGAMIGEASAELALSQAGSAAAVGPEPASLFGPFDRFDLYRQGWELVVEEHKPGLHYWTWRRHLRKGLFMYKSKTVYETATTAQIMDFTYDIEFRRTWDESMACQLAIAPPPLATTAQQGDVVSLAEADARSSGGKSAFMYARTKFPPPMASREYTYARRCWAKPDDGGCYCISRACAHPSPPPPGSRAVRITDFISGYVIRSSKGIFDTANPAVEVVNVYFEDPCVPSGIVNMSIRRALWPMVQKAEAAFRDYLLTRVHGNLERPPPERLVATDSLCAAMGSHGAHVARAAAADADAASCMGSLPPASGVPWRLVSPYILLYSGYMALWRGGRGTLLSALGCCMSLWCNGTGVCVGAWAVTRSGLHHAATMSWSILDMMSQALAAGQCNLQAEALKTSSTGRKAVHVVARAMWPWEWFMAGPQQSALDAASCGSMGGFPLSSSVTSSTGAVRLSSHPLTGNNTVESKRLSFAPRNGSGNGNVAAGGADGLQSPRGGGRRARNGLARRCALLAVKLAKVAGAGLLLDRAARTEGGSVQPAATTSGQQQSRGQARQQQQRVEAVPGTMPELGW